MSQDVETSLRALVESGQLTREQAAWCWDEGRRRGLSPLELARRAAAETPPAPSRATPSPARSPGVTPGGRGLRALPEPGDRIADYCIERKLGEGGMGAVFLARDGSGRPVALKLLTGLGESGRARFRRELETIVRVDRHPHIVRVLAADAEAELPWLALEFVAGESLDARLERDGPIPPEQLWPLAARVCEALDFLHSKGLLHRDLKPANVLLREDGAPMLADFGLAWREDAEALTRTGELVGTPAYMAPEAFEGKEQRGPAQDIWSMGVLLFECATGRRPFEADSGVELVARICSAAPPPPGRLNPALELAADALILQCLERDPTQRPSSAALAKDLQRLAAGERLESATASGLSRLALMRRRAGAGRLLVGGALVGLLALGAMALHAGRLARRQRQQRQAARAALEAIESDLAAALPELRAAADRALAERLLAALAADPADETSASVSEITSTTAVEPAPLLELAALEASWREDPATRPLVQRALTRPRIQTVRQEAALLGLPSVASGDTAEDPGARALLRAIARIPTAPAEAEAELRRQLVDKRRGEPAALGLVVLELRAGRLDAAERALPKSGSSAPLQALCRRLTIELGIRRWTASLTDPNESEGSLVRALDGQLASEAFGELGARDRQAAVQHAILRRCAELRSGPTLGEDERRLLRRLLALNDSFPWLRPPDWPIALLKGFAEDLHRARDYGPAQVLRALTCRAEPALEREFSFRVRDWQLIDMQEAALSDSTYAATCAVRWVSVAAALGLALPLGPTPMQLEEPELQLILERRQRERPDDPRRDYWIALVRAARLKRAVRLQVKVHADPSAPACQKSRAAVEALLKAGPPAPFEGMPRACTGLLVHWQGKTVSLLRELTKEERYARAAKVWLERALELGAPDEAELLIDIGQTQMWSGAPIDEVLPLSRRARERAVALLKNYEAGATQRADRPGHWPLRQNLHDIRGTYCAAHERETLLRVDLGELDLAERLARAALEHRPRMINARAALGRIALLRGELEDARRIAADLARDGPEGQSSYARDFLARVADAETR